MISFTDKEIEAFKKYPPKYFEWNSITETYNEEYSRYDASNGVSWRLDQFVDAMMKPSGDDEHNYKPALKKAIKESIFKYEMHELIND